MIASLAANGNPISFWHFTPGYGVVALSAPPGLGLSLAALPRHRLRSIGRTRMSARLVGSPLAGAAPAPDHRRTGRGPALQRLSGGAARTVRVAEDSPTQSTLAPAREESSRAVPNRTLERPLPGRPLPYGKSCSGRTHATRARWGGTGTTAAEGRCGACAQQSPDEAHRDAGSEDRPSAARVSGSPMEVDYRPCRRSGGVSAGDLVRVVCGVAGCVVGWMVRHPQHGHCTGPDETGQQYRGQDEEAQVGARSCSSI